MICTVAGVGSGLPSSSVTVSETVKLPAFGKARVPGFCPVLAGTPERAVSKSHAYVTGPPSGSLPFPAKNTPSPAKIVCGPEGAPIVPFGSSSTGGGGGGAFTVIGTVAGVGSGLPSSSVTVSVTVKLPAFGNTIVPGLGPFLAGTPERAVSKSHA